MYSGNVTEVNYGAGIMETILNHSVYDTKNIPFERQIYSKCSGRKVMKEVFFFFVDIMVKFLMVLFSIIIENSTIRLRFMVPSM